LRNKVLVLFEKAAFDVLIVDAEGKLECPTSVIQSVSDWTPECIDDDRVLLYRKTVERMAEDKYLSANDRNIMSDALKHEAQLFLFKL